MPVQRPFRFGVSHREATSRSAWQETARRAEALGYDILLMPDHTMPGLGVAPALMAAADATSRLRIGTFVLDNDFRQPWLVARDAATLDLLSDGRFELGIGAGWLREDYVQSGIPFDPPGVRVGRLEESVRSIKALLRGETVSFDGTHYTLAGLVGTPAPVQRPHPPLLIGGGQRRTLALAAREADIISVVPPALREGGLDAAYAVAERLDAQVATLRSLLAPRHDAVELNFLIQRVTITDTPEAEAEALAAAFGVPAEAILASPYFVIGSVDALVDQFRCYRERWGISYYVVFGPSMEDFAPVVAALAGR